ncbi:integrase [Clostridia bacterium]|nr:integrase [Clostridia bacterium]
MTTTDFTSCFLVKFNTFLEYRAARGFKTETYRRQLLKLDRYCAEHFSEISVLTDDIAIGWLNSDTKHSFTERAAALRQFGKYLNAIGEEAYVLPEKFASNRKSFQPYIFTDSEMTELFAAIDALPPFRDEPYLTEIAPTLFRLTYTCGLRPNESRELLRENVNLKSGEVLITHTKRNKERLIVMSDDMLKMAQAYDLRRGIFGSESPYFFPSSNGKAFPSTSVYSAFNKAWTNATCNAQNSVPRNVRVYDLRHRFASACLNRWLDNGENLMAMLPYLRTYMGHATMNETAYYIHILPENLVKSSAIDWDAFNSMFPAPMTETGVD